MEKSSWVIPSRVNSKINGWLWWSFTGSLAAVLPHFIEEPSETYVRKGKPTTLKCQVGGDPRPSIIWKRNGKQVTLDSRRNIKPDGSLYFTEILHNRTHKPDEGIYQCEAVSRVNSYDYKIISRTARVTVAGKLNLNCWNDFTVEILIKPFFYVSFKFLATVLVRCAMKFLSLASCPYDSLV